MVAVQEEETAVAGVAGVAGVARSATILESDDPMVVVKVEMVIFVFRR